MNNCLLLLQAVFSLSGRNRVRISLRSQLMLLMSFFGLLALPSASFAQVQPAPPAKKPPLGPPAPQSTHYPILLLAFGNDPNWSLRLGQKGPERLDRAGYPPIPLDPAEVTHEAAADSWTYHAKDSATGAAVAVHLTREACTDAVTDTLTATRPPAGRYSFRASVDHAQIGTLKGCARIAAELFPRIKNQPDDEDEDDKKKPPPPTITNFKPPVVVAYITPDRKMIFKRGAVARIIPGKTGYDFSISQDGKKLLFVRDEGPGAVRSINEYEFDSNSLKEWLRGGVRNPVWSPDDSRIAFLKSEEGKWHLWSAPAASSENAASLYPGEIVSIHGWVDAHTILADDLRQLYWISDNGTVQQTLSESDVFGDSFGSSTANTFRVHPLNPDLLLISAEWLKPPQGVPVDEHMRNSVGFFLYEIRSKRRVILSPLNMFAQNAEWSRDGLQIFFTGTDSSKRAATYRIFWDGTGLQKYTSGTGFVVGQ